SAFAVVRLPRPVPAGAQPEGAAVPAAVPTDVSTTGPTATRSAGPVSVRKQPGAAKGTGRPEYSPSSVVVSLRDPANTAPITSRGATVVGDTPGTGFVKVRTSGDRAALVAALQQDHGVSAAALDFGRRTTAVPNDPGYTQAQQVYLNTIRMPAAWDVITD